MQTQGSKAVLSSLAIQDVASINALRLMETPQGVQLLSSTTRRPAGNATGYETVISSTSLTQRTNVTSPLWALPQLLPPPPEWDVTLLSDNTPAVVYERALGATYTLLLKHAQSAEMPVTASYPLESFTAPRFVRKHRDAPGHLITAIAEKKRAVLFMQGQDGRFDKYTKLCDAQSAVMVTHRDEFILFYKVVVPGPVRGNLISPGTLHALRLGKNWAPTGTALMPFPDSTIFEFDVDVFGSRIVVFATSQSGTFLAMGASPNGPFQRLTFEEENNGERFSQPSVLATRTQVHYALLENARTDQARLLVGSTPLF